MTVYIGNFPQKYLQNIFGEYGGEESSVNEVGTIAIVSTHRNAIAIKI